MVRRGAEIGRVSFSQTEEGLADHAWFCDVLGWGADCSPLSMVVSREEVSS